MAGPAFGALPRGAAAGNEPAAPLPLAGSAWEVERTGDGKRDPQLYRFHANGEFKCRSRRGMFIFNNSARWTVKGNRFEVVVPDIEWRATGTFTDETIRGTIVDDGKKTAFQGRRVDPETYQFPLDEREAIVTVRLRRYFFDYPFPEGKEFDEYVKQDGGADLKRNRKADIMGFIFEVVAPKEYRGKYITAHHDGFLASGDATEIAKPGRDYLMRIGKQAIGRKDFAICSINLRLKPATSKWPLNP